MDAAPLHFERTSVLPVSADALYRWHARPGAFERLAPPWQQVHVIERHGSIHDGDRTVLSLKLAPLVWKRWVARHEGHVEGRGFSDVQVEGPFRAFRHEHRFDDAPEGGSVLSDRTTYVPPLGALGRVLVGRRIRRDLERAFTYRHALTRGDLAAHAAMGSEARPLRVLVSGASGLVGSALVPYLTTGGHTVTRLVRRAPGVGEVGWDPARGPLDVGSWPAFDALVHLAGENIAARRWSAAQKERIRASRVDATAALARGLVAAQRVPRVVVMASAVGVYGDRGDEVLREGAAPGTGFLAEVGQAWEAAARPLRDAGARLVALRLGAVLSPRGGALARLLPPFRAGVGGRIGPGTQWMPWIALDDVLDIVLRALLDERVEGAVHAVAPEALTNRDVAATLGRVLRRPTFLPLPAFAARLAFGEMAREVLLASQRVEPARLLALGHVFRFRALEPALRHMLGRYVLGKPA
jgi:uncharacterized protein (TIGR01777 family)